MKDVLRGLLAGVWGVLGMAGVSFTIRRFVEPTKPIGQTHYESVVEWARELPVAGSETLEPETRVRTGEMAHLSFGAFWGVVLQFLTRRTELRPWVHGGLFGIAIWLLAFAGYMPALGISRPLWRMRPHEFLRTLAAHITFATTTCLVLRSMRD